jgi:hypothetical protein
MAMGRLGFSVAEVGRGGRERTVDVSPGTRRTTSFWMLWGFWKEVGMKGSSGELGRLIAHLYSDPARWWGISYDVKDKVTYILETIGKRGEEHEETVR